MSEIVHQSPRARTASLALEWPFTVDDEDVDAISIRRLTGAEVAALQEMMTDGGSEADMIAAFCDQPAEVIGQLDADDYVELKLKVVDFLPRRLRAMIEAETAQS